VRAPLALVPAAAPRDLVWPAVFGYLGAARWASMYAVAAGACVAWTSTWWGTGLPWAGGGAPGTVPGGALAGLALVTWVVLGSWLFLGWRTVAVESGPAGEGAAGKRAAGEGAVDNRASASPGWATLPVGAPDTGGWGAGAPGNGAAHTSDGAAHTTDGAVHADGAAHADGAVHANGHPPLEQGVDP